MASVVEQNTSLSPGDPKRKATEILPTRSKKARNHHEEPEFSAPSDDEHSDGFDNEHDDFTDSGATTPLTTQSSGKTIWPSRQKTIPCPYADCNKTFNRQAKLQDHIRSHTNERPFVCSELGCDKSFNRKTHLDRHVKSAHTAERDYACSIAGCGKAFSTGTRLRRHEAQHAARSEFKCSECGQEFRKQATLQRHIDSEHKGQKPCICDSVLDDGSVCGVGFAKAYALKVHQARTHNEKRYWCDICIDAMGSVDGKDSMKDGLDRFGFATYAEFQVHIREVHPPTCHLCGAVSQTAKELTRHKELEHGIFSGAEKPSYACPEPGCDRVFTKKGNLDVHFRSVHTNQRPFICGAFDLLTLNNVQGWDGHDACGKDFKAKSQLEEHIRTAHLGLLNRAQIRKQAKAAKTNADNSSQAVCPVTGCQATFAKNFECDTHLQIVHGLDVEDEFDTSIFDYLDPDAKGGKDSQAIFGTISNMVQDVEAELPDLGLALESNALQGRTFWLGGDDFDESRGQIAQVEDFSFQNTQNEISRLVGAGHGWEDNILVDPALTQH